ncbi:NADH dehydrogenase (ubiquinone) 1 beta subcomplex subunit 6 [Paragonimus westermani]|uniref:NADH dehydrogenase (Ubiquinone) 1 beta subcomplex subunit 6 n=1 Tax=Paragonimus westermani TaxID=34504 RepID=A0A5J4NEY6_9TREM|nr:NADH dehydrogenase (ubiquinone) 1 beta subcomplex subunit 6 [Paragonimus westermani]
MGDVTAGNVPPIDPEVLELQKKLYREQLVRQATIKRGSKFYPINIEPFALERDRLALPFTDQDRAMRKQWQKDQALSDREPVDVPEWTRVNIFRRVYRKPFDAITNLVKPFLGPEYSRYFRWTLPKVVVGLSLTWLFWYNVKYSPSVSQMFWFLPIQTWEDGRRGIRVQRAYKPSIYPGQPDFPNSPLLTREFGMEDFDKRTVFRGEKLVTSGP